MRSSQNKKVHHIFFATKNVFFIWPVKEILTKKWIDVLDGFNWLKKKWKNHFCYHVNIFNHSLLSLFWEKTSSLYVCSLKNVQFFWFDSCLSQTLLSMRTMTLRPISSIQKKQQRQKKVSNFHVATFVWINKSFEFVSSKLGLSKKKCVTPPIKRLLHLLFYFKKCPQNSMSKRRNFHFCKHLNF